MFTLKNLIYLLQLSVSTASFSQALLDPREIDARLEEIDTSITIPGGENSADIEISSSAFRMNIEQNGNAIASEEMLSDSKVNGPKTEKLNTIIREAIKNNKSLKITTQKNKWHWLEFVDKPNWREVPDEPASYDSRNILIRSINNGTLELWHKGKVLFSEKHGNEESKSVKSFLLKQQLIQACNQQSHIKIIPSKEWHWITPVPEKLNSNFDASPRFTVEHAGKKVIVRKNGAIVATENHSSKSSALQKAEQLSNQILKACQQGQDLTLTKSSDSKWVSFSLVGLGTLFAPISKDIIVEKDLPPIEIETPVTPDHSKN